MKGTPAAPHLTAPHTALLSSSLALELTPTAHLHRRRFAAVARPLHHRPVSGEGTPGTSASPSPSSAPRGNLRRAVGPVHCAPAGAPPRSQPHHRGPPWTEAGRRPRTRGLGPRVFFGKIILKSIIPSSFAKKLLGFSKINPQSLISQLGPWNLKNNSRKVLSLRKIHKNVPKLQNSISFQPQLQIC
jgi:hypothetical protein